MLLVCACSASNDSDDPGRADEATRYDLRGNWAIWQLDGAAAGARIELIASENTLTWQPGCAGWSASYRTEGTGIVIERERGGGARSVCAVGYAE